MQADTGEVQIAGYMSRSFRRPHASRSEQRHSPNIRQDLLHVSATLPEQRELETLSVLEKDRSRLSVGPCSTYRSDWYLQGKQPSGAPTRKSLSSLYLATTCAENSPSLTTSVEFVNLIF
jgi:hypothetical protein